MPANGPQHPEAGGPSGSPALDDRTGFLVAEAAVRLLAELDPELADEDAAWDAFVDWIGRDQREYIEAVRRTRHSIFYYLAMRFYDFAVERVGREDFPLLCGRSFAETVYDDNLYRMLRVVLGHGGSFLEAIVRIFRAYLDRYTEGRYRIDSEALPDETVFTISMGDPQLALRYLARYGLDPARAFRNSFLYIAGAVERLFPRLVKDFDGDRFSVEALVGRGRLHVPITDDDRFDFEGITQSLIAYVRKVEEHCDEAAEDDRLESDLIVGSRTMRRTWERIRRASRSEEIVLLRGESGTGKSFIARKIHELSSRAERPFVEVCLASDIGSDNMIQSDLFGHAKGAFTGAVDHKKGLFSLADGGTIFLDEIGDASAELQAKLLRVIESSTFKCLGGVEDISVDVRVIAATNQDLEKMVEEGTFRRDLYYRLNVIPVELPPLRERPEDIPALAEFLLARGRKGGGAHAPPAPGLAEGLRAYSWPGNIRELDHALRHAAAMSEGPQVTLADLPERVREAVREFLVRDDRAGGGAGGPAARDARARGEEGPAGRQGADAGRPGRVIDTDELRRAVRRADGSAALGSDATFDIPAHIDYARRRYLGVLIDELGGDLSRIGRFWDRGSEKTLRKVVKAFGLADRLDAARARRPRP